MLFPVKRARTKSGKKGVGLKEGEVESCRFFPRWKPAAWFALPEQRASSDSSSCWIHQALRSLYSFFISKWYTQWIVDYTSLHHPPSEQAYVVSGLLSIQTVQDVAVLNDLRRRELALSAGTFFIHAMGNKISNVTAIAGIDSYVSELSDVYYERRYTR